METLLKALDLVIENKIWEDKKPSEVLKILMLVNSKGFLYTPIVNGEIKAVLCAYRIKDINNLTKIPLKEEGKILYVPFLVSVNKNEDLFNIIRESCRIYLENNSDIEEIILEDKNNKIKRYRLKGDNNGKKQRFNSSRTAKVSNRP